MKNKQHKNGLAASIMRLMIILFVVLTVIVADISYHLMSNMLMRHYSQKAEEVSAFEAVSIDGDRIAAYLESGETDTYYDDINRQLSKMKESMDELAYLYVFVPYEDHFVYVWDAYGEGEDVANFSSLGDVYEYSETEYTYLVPDVQAKRASDQLIYGDDVGFGTSVSAWCPIFDSNGQLAAMVEADYRIDDLTLIIIRSVAPIVAALVSALLVLLFLVLYFLRKRVTDPIAALTDYVNSYQTGTEELDGFAYKKDDEIQWLANSFDEMAQRIRNYIDEVKRVTAERERIGAELNVATQIQKSMLPCIFPAFPEREEFDIYATMTPAKEVGGDFYDFFMIDKRHLAIVMADVSGKGVPASLFMVIGKTLIKDHTIPGSDLGTVFTRVNNLLCESNSEDLFITAFEGVLDLVTGEFNFVNAGHEIPFFCRKGGSFEPKKLKAGFVLAGVEDMEYQAGSMVLEPGDKVFQYTDGVPEATDANNELFGMERLEESLKRVSAGSTVEILDAVKSDVDAFVGEAPQFDDITMLCLEYKKRMEE